MPMAEYERDQLEQIEADRLKLLSKFTDELGLRQEQVAKTRAERRAALAIKDAHAIRDRAIKGRLRRYTR